MIPEYSDIEPFISIFNVKFFRNWDTEVIIVIVLKIEQFVS